MTTAIERLEDLLNEKDQTIEKLQDKIDWFEYIQDKAWAIHSTMDVEYHPEGPTQ